MPSPFNELQRRKHRIIRGASQGADISLASAYDGYHAAFECAVKVAEVLGPEGSRDYGSKAEPLPAYVIPVAQMQKACEKLSQLYSVAILDSIASEKGDIVWGLVWKIRKAEGGKPAPVQKEISLDDF